MSVTSLKGNWFDFHVQALQRVAALPGVQNAAFGWGLPLTGNAWLGAVQAADEPPKPLKDWETISIRAVSPDYFDTMSIRSAVGAQRRDILRLVLGDGLRLIASGIVLGTASALLLGKLLNSLLFGVHASDPATCLRPPVCWPAGCPHEGRPKSIRRRCCDMNDLNDVRLLF